MLAAPVLIGWNYDFPPTFSKIQKNDTSSAQVGISLMRKFVCPRTELSISYSTYNKLYLKNSDYNSFKTVNEKLKRLGFKFLKVLSFLKVSWFIFVFNSSVLSNITHPKAKLSYFEGFKQTYSSPFKLPNWTLAGRWSGDKWQIKWNKVFLFLLLINCQRDIHNVDVYPAGLQLKISVD